MLIEVAVNNDDPQKKKGDLLERISKNLLESQNFEVETELRRTGVELDLLCRHKANAYKKIYVECKAYDENNKIDSGIIYKLCGIREKSAYQEAWLVSTTELGKDAKGTVQEIEDGPTAKLYTFFTPKKLIDAFVSANIIKDSKIAHHVISQVIKEKNKLGETVLLITEYGMFWAFEYLSGGKPKGALFVFADSGEVVKEKALLDNLAETNSSYKKLDFFTIFNFLDDKEKQAPNIDIKDINLSKEYLNKINDLGLKLIHPNKDILILNDIFVYPDLDLVENDDTQKINSKKLLELTDKLKRNIIYGEDLSGKTSLAYSFQKDLHSKGFIPIFLTGDEIKHSGFDKMSTLLVKKFQKQYEDSQIYLTSFQKSINEKKSKIIILIDNFENLEIKRDEAKLKFLNMLRERFEYIFIFANKSIEIEVMAKKETNELFQGFNLLRIKQLGHLLRDELVEKWLTLEQEETLLDSYILHKKIEVSKKISIATGKNFVPTYPLYVLTMLQVVETGSKNDLKGSSYAELYSYLINHALGSAQAKPEDLDFYHTYLAHLSHYIFINKKSLLSKEELNKFYEAYSKLMDIEKSFDSVHSILTKAKLLKYDSNSYSFYHNYCYYFFVAKYFSDNLEDSKVKEEISVLTKKLYLNEAANIIIFLIHHSKNPGIINGILDEAKKIFTDVSPFTLSLEETNNINNLIHEEIALSIVDNNPSENRKKDLERKDNHEDEKNKKESSKATESKEKNELNLFEKINLAFKLIEVLGQITNNYYGSLAGEKKADILEEVYSLGFRGLRALLEDMEQYIKVIQTKISEDSDKKKNSTNFGTDQIINKFIYQFIELMVLVFVKRISDSIISKNLFPTTTKVMDRNPVPATMLVNMAIRLNFPDELITNKAKIIQLDSESSKNHLLNRLLKILVIEHLYKFDVKYSDKQSICNKLGIQLIPKSISPVNSN